MEHVKNIKWNDLNHEYGLDGQRLLPWAGTNFPFGGAYCIVRAGTSSLEHINEPVGEEEFFICISGNANVHIDKNIFNVMKGDTLYIPAGKTHYIVNDGKEDFHLYALWWNKGTISESLKNFK